MNCKYCGYSGVPDGSLYCNMCGKAVRRVRSKGKTEVKVPDPKPLADGFYIRFMVDGTSRYVSAPTAEECIAKAVAIKTGIVDVPKHARVTLGKLIDDYIANCKTLSPSTVRGYKRIRAIRFQNYMDLQIDSVKNWQKVINEECALGLSVKTVKNAWGLVTAAMRFAHYPVPEVKFPQRIKSERTFFTPEQIRIFVDAVKDDPYCIGSLLALHSLRRSEILDITWEDIDLENDIIHVRGAAVIGPDGSVVHKTTNKTESSCRDIPIMIPELKSALAAADKSREYIVPYYPNTLYKAINKLCAKHGLPEVGVHGLRHSFASLAYHLNIPIEITCKMGGWSSTKTVMEIYTHLYEEDIMLNQNKMKDFYTLPPVSIANSAEENP